MVSLTNWDLEIQILQLLIAAVEATHFKEERQEYVAEMESGQEKRQHVRPQRINCHNV